MSDQTRKAGVLQALSADIDRLTRRHESTVELWFPAELLTPFFDATQSPRLSDAVKSIPSAYKAALALNLVTEDGLPYFSSLLATHLGDEGPWVEWTRVWTAEEQRHGNVLNAYVMLTGIIDCVELDHLRHSYLRRGFYPNWGHDPYRLLAYTSLQEYATQVSHSRLGKACGALEPVLGNILINVAKDEARHYVFYREAFKHILALDTDGALESLYAVMRTFEMPGATTPSFKSLAAIQERAGIFTTTDYCMIVEQLTRFWGIETCAPQSDEGKQARDGILVFPKRLKKIIERNQSGRDRKQTFTVPCIGEPVVI